MKRAVQKGGDIEAPEQPIFKITKANIVVTNPMCVGVVGLALVLLAFSGGYMFREHQSEEDKLRITALESVVLAQSTDVGEAATQAFLTAYAPIGDQLDNTIGNSTCGDGLLLAGPEPTVGNTIKFTLLLLWSFLGVAVFADLFMLAIERITAQERVQRITLPNGKAHTITTLTWNATVANLTLMALGSSAPEILLSVIEIMTSGFYAGALGPSTIVGSAAFNMLVISAVCVMAIPDGEGRFIKELPVFGITAVFSVGAYVWLLYILVYSSPNVVEMWEGAVTFGLFPFLVWLAFLADQGVLAGMIPRWCSCASFTEAKDLVRQVKVLDESKFDGAGAGARAATNSKAFYRVNAMREISGFRSIEETADLRRALLESMVVGDRQEVNYSEVYFVSTRIAVRKEDSDASLVIFRTGNTRNAARVQAVCSFSPGTPELVEFQPMQTSATLEIELLDEDKAVHKDGQVAFDVTLVPLNKSTRVLKNPKCEVECVSDNHAGVFTLAEDMITVDEENMKAMFTVRRENGTRGTVACDVNTKDGSAVAPSDYIAIEDHTLVFREGEMEKSITVSIVNDGAPESNEWFNVIFSNATGGASFSVDCDGGPDRAVATVTIKGQEMGSITCPPANCDELAFLLGLNLDEVKLTTFAWSHQFAEAVDFEAGSGYVAFFIFLLSLPWKLAISFAPPPRMHGGWACFIIVLALIGGLTALIGDLAAHMGCCMGLTPAITAITFVALGTSLPDTFASMSAAVAEEYADSSIGNITGSNSVNVFLGLGLPWLIAAVYWSGVQASSEAGYAWHDRYAGEPWYTPGMPIGFAVPAGDLGFSVAVFCVAACACLFTLMLRRAVIGFELGLKWRIPTALFFVGLWFAYIAANVIYTS